MDCWKNIKVQHFILKDVETTFFSIPMAMAQR